MLKVENNEHQNYSRFDDMPTDVLEAFLAADVDAPEAEQMDIEAIIYITDLLAERRKAAHTYPKKDVATAKAEFFEYYYPLAEKGETAYDFADEEASNPVQYNKPKAWVGWLRRMGVAVAAVFVLLLTGTVTAAAFGYNPWQTVAKWTDDILWFEPTNANPTVDLQASLDAYGIVEQVTPTWLPEGYEFVSLDTWEDDSIIEFASLYTRTVDDEEENLSLNIVCHLTGDVSAKIYQKDDAKVILHTVNGIDHYIICNVNCRAIVWQNLNAECSINGQFTEKEAIKIIDSIYEE